MDFQSGPSIEVSQEEAIEELEEIPVDRNTKKDLHCTPTMHARYRSLLGQINGFCRVGHSSSVGTSCPDVLQRQLLQQLVMWRLLTNKLARQFKRSPVKLQFWPLTGPLRTIGFLDASYRNNEDGSSQRGMTVSSAELREHSAKDGISYGSIVELRKSKD